MTIVGRRGQRGTVAAMSAVALTGALIAAFNACSLDSTALGSMDGGALDSTTRAEASLDASEAGLPGDGAADVRDEACLPSETDCLDGIDNDCNGLTDCADPACTAGYSCVPEPAGGFRGYALYAPTRASPCPASYSDQSDTFEDIAFVPASCSACTCTGEGASCGTPTLTCTARAAGCSEDGGTSVVLAPTCSAFDAGAPFGPATSCSLAAPVATPGSCVAGGGVAALAPVAFAQLSRVCAITQGPGGGCDAGSVCVANAPAGFQGGCVFETTNGPATCPARLRSAHVTVPSDTSYDDTRGCTSCSCTGPLGAACSAVASLFVDAGCAGAPATSIPADGNCYGTLFGSAESIASLALDAGVVSEGSCLASGGQITGGVTPTNQTIYCCQP
jgi:hypothetical protein